MRSSVLITYNSYKFLENLIRQQKLSGHPKQFMITFDLIIEDRHFQVEIETISVFRKKSCSLEYFHL